MYASHVYTPPFPPTVHMQLQGPGTHITRKNMFHSTPTPASTKCALRSGNPPANMQMMPRVGMKLNAKRRPKTECCPLQTQEQIPYSHATGW